MDYAEFIDRKTQLGSMEGFDPIWMPDFLFPFQQHLTDWALRKGRGGLFEDCGLGKSPQELVWGENVVRKTNKPVLLLTPIAVGAQMLGEAAKFDIEAHRSRDGKVYPGITITNYEKLHLFNPSDFGGVITDECFARGTLVDTPYGKKHIENIRPGEYIVNCVGVDRVSDVHKREVQYATLVKIGGASFIASPNHPIFTQRGWIGAQHLRAGDYALATGAAMSLVRQGDYAKVSIPIRSTVLREILLSEMADDAAGCFETGTYGGGSCSYRKEKGSMVGWRKPKSVEGNVAYCDIESNKVTGSAQENLHPTESHEAQTFRAWGQWSRDDIRAGSNDGCAWTWMDSGISFVVGPTKSRLSVSLQNRLRESANEVRYRGGWQLAPRGNEKGRGCEERKNATFTRVDGIEILERGNPRLEQLREEDGKLYFYDLGATRHPSYSVCGYLVHNSSILKSFDGQYKSEITEFMRKIPYRLLGTATAAPNDYIELGTSSEALGELGYMDMLSRFFKNDQGNSIKSRVYHQAGSKESFAQLDEAAKWRLKGHAEVPFWRWVCSWARACRKPSDLGFDDGAFTLPELIERDYLVEASTNAPGMLFALPAVGLKEQREERRRTIKERCAKVAELVTDPSEATLIWCHLNEEGDLLERLIPGSVQVSGKDSDEQKEEKFLAFSSGQAKKLITKPKIGAWGMNWQHCAHQTFFPSHSFEQYYQGVRRSWRFGQTRPVRVDIVTTEGEKSVLKNLQRKAQAADKMFSKLVEHMRDAEKVQRSVPFTKAAEVPSWI